MDGRCTASMSFSPFRIANLVQSAGFGMFHAVCFLSISQRVSIDDCVRSCAFPQKVAVTSTWSRMEKCAFTTAGV